MKILKYFLLGFLYLQSSSISAQENKTANSLLWEISGNGLQKPSYLFGTYHFAGKDLIDTMQVLQEKLKNSEAIVGEIILDASASMKLMPFLLMKNNFLDKLLSPGEYKKVADYLKEISGYDLKMFNSMKPVAIQTTILQFIAPGSIRPDNPAIDQYLQTYGKANQKKVIGLETVEDQAAILFGYSLERQKELLLKSIENMEKSKAEAATIFRLYKAQNLSKLEKYFNRSDDYTPEEMDMLLKNRNEKWMAQLPAIMQEKPSFVAVGAGHLTGENGLIKLLKAKGYELKPLRTN